MAVVDGASIVNVDLPSRSSNRHAACGVQTGAGAV